MVLRLRLYTGLRAKGIRGRIRANDVPSPRESDDALKTPGVRVGCAHRKALLPTRSSLLAVVAC